MAIFP